MSDEEFFTGSDDSPDEPDEAPPRVPSARDLKRQKIAEYRAAALQCMKSAETERDRVKKDAWMTRAREWFDLADALERNGDVDSGC